MSDVEIEDNYFPHPPGDVAIAKHILEIAKIIAPNRPEVREKTKTPVGIFYDDSRQHSHICGERYRELLGAHSGDVTLGEPAEELIDLAAMMWKRLNGDSRFDRKIRNAAEGLVWQMKEADVEMKAKKLVDAVEQAALDYCLVMQEEASKKKPGKRDPNGPNTDKPDESRRPDKSPDEPETPDAPPDMNPEAPEEGPAGRAVRRQRSRKIPAGPAGRL